MTVTDPPDPARRRLGPVRRRGMSPSAAWKAMVLGLALYCLLASGSLVRAARGQADGPVRAVTLPVATAIDRVANFLSLNRPYDLAASALGRGDAEAEPIVEFPPVTRPPLNQSVTTTTFPSPRPISVTRPMRVEVFGDSLAIGLGKALQDVTGGDALVSVDYDGRVSSGLARQDFYNWPARMVEQLTAQDADVVVLQVGANDDKPLTRPDGTVVAAYGTPEWDVEYRRRIAGVFDLLNNRRRRVVWVGEPVMRRGDLNPLLAKINAMAREEAVSRPWVVVVDPNPIVAGPDGEYVDYVTPADGSPAFRCRLPDGVHPTTRCAQLIARAVLAAVRPLFPVATTTTAPPSPAPSGPVPLPPSTTSARVSGG